MNYLRISEEIRFDIDTGLYSDFPKLKSRLQFIADKLIKCYHINNKELSDGEIRTLQEYEYME